MFYSKEFKKGKYAIPATKIYKISYFWNISKSTNIPSINTLNSKTFPTHNLILKWMGDGWEIPLNFPYTDTKSTAKT